MIRRGDIVWVDFGVPRGSAPAFRRPGVIVQEEWLLNAGTNTVVIIPLTTTLGWQNFPGNVFLPHSVTGLDQDSVAQVAQIMTVDRENIEPYPAGRVVGELMRQLEEGIRLSFGL